MKLLLDTNIFLEVILEQERSEEVKKLLSKVEEYEFFISDFSPHSIEFLLFCNGKHEMFRRFFLDMISRGILTILYLSAREMEDVIDIAQKYNLGFDDAYQYAIADRYNLTIVSFDGDFDRTVRGCKTPMDLLEK